MSAPLPSTYVQPTVVWRLHQADGRRARGVIVPRWRDAAALWFIDDEPEDAHDCPTWDAALAWIEAVRRQLLAEGWNDDA